MSPPRVVGVTAARHRPDALEAARHAAARLRELGLRVVEDRLPAAGCDLILALGGDGTVVGAAREASPAGIPVIGINFGTFGFLTEIDADAMDEALALLAAGCYDVEERLMLAVCIEHNGRRESCATASNDVAVTAGEKGRVLDLLVFADGHQICDYPADGLIVATPTGSTAYSLSAGGPVLAPTVDAFVLTPICPHSLSVRPLVVSADAVIRVEIGEQPRMSRQGVVSVDGQIAIDVLPGAGVVVQRAEQRMRLARLRPSMFFDSLRHKLRWGSR